MNDRIHILKALVRGELGAQVFVLEVAKDRDHAARVKCIAMEVENLPQPRGGLDAVVFAHQAVNALNTARFGEKHGQFPAQETGYTRQEDVHCKTPILRWARILVPVEKTSEEVPRSPKRFAHGTPKNGAKK